MTDSAISITDPELQALPEPRRPWRRTTVAMLCGTLGLSLVLIALLSPQLRYALHSGDPVDLGTLDQATLQPQLANLWVHGTGAIDAKAIAYHRPLSPGEYRLAPIVGNDELWVEMRLPGELDPERFIPPTSFVGRLVPLAQAGLGYAQLAQEGLGPNLQHSWVLLDGESPAGERWVFGVLALLLAFAGFASLGLYHLLRRAS